VSLAASGDASPAVRVDMTFASEQEATAFEAGWPGIRERWRHQTVVLLSGLGGLLDGLEAKREGTRLMLMGRIAEGQMRGALTLAVAMLPKPPPRVGADGGVAPAPGASAPAAGGGAAATAGGGATAGSGAMAGAGRAAVDAGTMAPAVDPGAMKPAIHAAPPVMDMGVMKPAIHATPPVMDMGR
jgi:hypothetical protein